MYDIITGTFTLDNPILWIDFSISIILLALIAVVYAKVNSKKTSLIFGICLEVFTLAFWFFGLKFAWVITLAINVAVCASLLINQSIQVKRLFSFNSKKRKIVVDKIYDRQAVAQKIAIAVDTLSKSKTGALITFEKNDKLNDAVKSGTILNAPITPELLTTIFYPGTRLHDGAVVIRRDEILAASVYFTPTTKPLNGKYGSRHRAAIGISEKTDSVTVVVSEETGRVNIAYKGELIPVAHDNFIRTFEDYLLMEEE